ncbi:MAG: hypothetical protein HC772_04285 [Leptolyngbyaceae cyanobacterium CRU_2_3]|nr:hypothetical protein [Leptolyngbyaceae cyanobacterium CRU_2_3]
MASSHLLLHRALELNPDSPWTHYHLGTALSRQQQWQAASAAFLSAIQLQADLAGVYSQLGYVLRHYLQVAEASTVLEYCQQAIHLDRRTTKFYVQVADGLAQAQQFDGAIAFYDLALSLAPESLAPESLESNYTILQQRSQALLGKQHLDQIMTEHRLDIQQHPDYAWLYTHLANLLADQGEVDEAVALHRTASVLKGWQSAAARNYQFTHDWFTHNIPVWTTCLKPFAHYPNTQALEIGSFEGMSACWFLDHILTHPLSHLTCIDQYFQEAFETNIAQTGSAERLIQLTGDSHAVLSTLAPESYDIIYVDGCHLAQYVQQDASLSWKLLKAGGILIFDDYQWTDPSYPGQDTQIGIDAFLSVIQDQMKVLHQGYQMIIQKLRITSLTEQTLTSSKQYSALD